jgi:hypothetical protein
MAKRTNYSKVSLKAKVPKSIRYNVKDFEAACGLSGRSTVQGMWDYLLTKYLADMGVRMVAPIGKMDMRPIDKNIFDVSKDVGFYMPRHEDSPPPKVSFFGEPLIVPKRSLDMDEMPMWKPKPKIEKAQTKAETEKFAAAEMKRLKEMQERAAMVKGKKK